jgi:hypothetical protein
VNSTSERGRRGARRPAAWLRVAAALALLCVLVPATAAAAPVAQLHASFVPYRLGASTTVKFGFDIKDGPGVVPPPLTLVDLSIPKGLNQNASELGLAICKPKALEALGARGCPENSKVGFGKTDVEVEFGGERIRQTTKLDTFLGPPETADELMFLSTAQAPIASRVVYFGKSLEDAEGPFAGTIETVAPLVATAPEAPFLSTTSFESTLGPLGLTYERKIHGHTESFHPEGILLPKVCPRGGFRFKVKLGFADGSTASDRTSVPCPRAR